MGNGQVQARPGRGRGVPNLHIQFRQMFLNQFPGAFMEAADPGLIRAGNHISPAVHHVDVLSHHGPYFLHNGLGSLS